MSAGAGRDNDYVERLGEVLKSRKPALLRAFLIENAMQFGGPTQAEDIERQGDDEMLALLHRMTLARADLDSFHEESRRWLAERGIASPAADDGQNGHS